MNGLAWLGWLQGAYGWVYMHTTGQPWTDIMRAHPLYLFLPMVILMAILGKVLPEKPWAPVILLRRVLT